MGAITVKAVPAGGRWSEWQSRGSNRRWDVWWNDDLLERRTWNVLPDTAVALLVRGCRAERGLCVRFEDGSRVVIRSTVGAATRSWRVPPPGGVRKLEPWGTYP